MGKLRTRGLLLDLGEGHRWVIGSGMENEGARETERALSTRIPGVLLLPVADSRRDQVQVHSWVWRNEPVPANRWSIVERTAARPSLFLSPALFSLHLSKPPSLPLVQLSRLDLRPLLWLYRCFSCFKFRSLSWRINMLTLNTNHLKNAVLLQCLLMAKDLLKHI